METPTILNKSVNMYTVDDFSEFATLNIKDLNNKLFCTFTTLDELDPLINRLTSTYSIMYNKIFVLHVKSNNEYVCTYNIDQANLSTLPENTILVHRKKESNTLYTINALNEVIKYLNNGILDTSYQVDWNNYRNSLLLTRPGGFKKLRTRLKDIIEIK